jgi:hypothetical protein
MLSVSTLTRRLAVGWTLLVAALLLPALVPSGAAQAAGHAPTPVRQATAAAPAPFQVALTDLGFTAGVVMHGARPGARLSLPLPRRGIQHGQLLLNLDVSPVVHPNATVEVTVDGRPASAVTVAQVRESRTVEVPVQATTRPFLNVDIGGALFSAAEQCVLENDDGLWLLLGQDSRLVSGYALDSASVADFLSVPGGIVAVQGRWETPADREASIALFSAAQHVLRDRGSRVLLAEDVTSAVPAAQEQPRTIALGREGDPLLKLEGTTLTVSPHAQAREALAAERAEMLRTGQMVPSVERIAPAPSPIWSAVLGPVASYRRDLSTLGLDGGERTGTGVLASPIRFTIADLGGWPSDLMLDMSATFDQISTGTLERALLRVRLNETLVETADLGGVTSYQKLIPLPAVALRPSNQLDLDFIYAPDAGNCAGAPVAFTGQIQGGSGLTWSSYGSGKGLLPEVIGSLDQTDVVLADESPETARTAARLVGGLSRLVPHPISPRLVSTAALGQRRTGAATLVVGGTAETLKPLGLPIAVGPSLSIVDTRTSTTVLQGTPDGPLVAAQYLPGAAPVLAIQASPGADPRLLDAGARELVDPARFLGWSGNVVVGVPGDMVSLDLNGSGLRAREASAWDWRILLSRYRWMVTAVVVALVLAGCWSTYRRLGQPRAIPVPSGPTGGRA